MNSHPAPAPRSPEDLLRALGARDSEPVDLECRALVDRERDVLADRLAAFAELLDSAPVPPADEFERLASEVAERRERLADSLAEVVAPAAGIAAEAERLLEPTRQLLGEARTAAEIAERLEFAEVEELEDLGAALEVVLEFDTATARPELSEWLARVREVHSRNRQHLESVRRLDRLGDLHRRVRRLERCRLRPVPRATDHTGGAPPPEPRRSPIAANAPPSSATRARTAATAA